MACFVIYKGKRIPKEEFSDNLVKMALGKQTTTSNQVAEGNTKEEAPTQEGEVADEEYNNFIDKGEVSSSRINSIADKVKKQQQLSERENAIFTSKTAEVNKVIADKKAFDDAYQAFMEDPSEENGRKLNEAQQALQKPAEPSTKTVPFQQQINELGKLDPGQEFTDKARMIIEQSSFDEPTKRELLGLLNVPKMNLNDKNRLVKALEKAAGTSTTTIKETTLRNKLREAWSKGITLGVKDAETRAKDILSSIKEITSSIKGTIPGKAYKVIINRLKSLNTKNPVKVSEFIDYVSKVTENSDLANKAVALRKLQLSVKSKINQLTDNQKKLLKPLFSKRVFSDAENIDEVIAILQDVQNFQKSSVDPTRTSKAPSTADLERISNKAKADLIKKANDRKLDNESDNLFADETTLEDTAETKRQRQIANIKSLLDQLKSLPAKVKVKYKEQIELLSTIGDKHFEIVPAEILERLQKGLENLRDNGDFGIFSYEGDGILATLQAADGLLEVDQSFKKAFPGATTAFGFLKGTSRNFRNIGNLLDYVYNGVTDVIAKFRAHLGVGKASSGKTKLQSFSHNKWELIMRAGKEIAKKFKGFKPGSVDTGIRLSVFGEFSSRLKGATDQQMLDAARHNWTFTSNWYKKEGNKQENKRLQKTYQEAARIIDEMLALFDGAKTIDEVNKRMEKAFPAVKEFRYTATDTLEKEQNIKDERLPSLRDMAEYTAEVVYGKQPQMYEPGTYWPQSNVKTSTKQLSDGKRGLSLGTDLPDNLIERLPRITTPRSITGLKGVRHAIHNIATGYYMGEAIATMDAAIKLDAANGNKWFGNDDNNKAFFNAMESFLNQNRQETVFHDIVNLLQRTAMIRALSGPLSMVNQFGPGAMKVFADFTMKNKGFVPYNLFMNGAGRSAARKVRKMSATGQRLAFISGEGIEDAAALDANYKSIWDHFYNGLDEVTKKIAKTVPKYTFGVADASLAERAWTTAYLDYLNDNGVDVSDTNNDDFWNNELKQSDTKLRKQAREAAEQYVSSNLKESSSFETATIFKNIPLLKVMVPFSGYSITKSTAMNNRYKTMTSASSTSDEKRTAARRLATDMVEIAAYTHFFRFMVTNVIQDMMVEKMLESYDLEPESDEDKEKREKSRQGYALMEAIIASIPNPMLLVVANMIPDHIKADWWNGLMQSIGQEEDQKTSEFMKETELPVVPSVKSANEGLIGVVFPEDNGFELGDDGLPYVITKDLLGDDVKKYLTEDQKDALDNKFWINFWGMIGLKELSNVLKRVERRALKDVKSGGKSSTPFIPTNPSFTPFNPQPVQPPL